MMNECVKGLVSVVMPTYKRSEMLTRAIDSVLNQTYANIELIVVNDNDPHDLFTSQLKERVKKYEDDPRFKLVIQEKHTNGAVARNLGIAKCKGEFIAFLDDDDWWDKDKIRIQKECFDRLDESYGVVSCRIIRFSNNIPVARLPKYKEGNVYVDILSLTCDYATGTLLFRKRALDDCGYFDEKLLRHQDLQVLSNVCFKYKLKFVDRFLHFCDIDDNSNRPDVEKIIKAKRMFFLSIACNFSSLSFFKRRAIKKIHKVEIGYVELKNKKRLRGFINVIQILTSPYGTLCLIKRFKNKMKSRIL